MLATCGIFCLVAGAISAGEPDETKMVLHFSDDSETREELLSDIDVITFADNDFSVEMKSSDVLKYSYDEIARIMFASNFTGIQQISEAGDVVVYPNPASDFVSLKNFDASGPVRVAVYSIDGQCRLVIDGWENGKIDVSGLERGMYLLNVNGKTYKFRKL